MLLSLAGAATRFLGLLALALAPWAAPLDPHSGGGLAIALALVIVVGAAFVTVRLGRSHRAQALAMALPFAAAAIGALLFDPSSGPLAQGVWLVGPLAWIAIATIVFGRLPPRAGTIGAGLVIVLGVVSFAAAMPRIASRDVMWEAILDADPGDSDAALAIASTRDSEGDERAARTVIRRCADVGGCGCVVALAERELRTPAVDELADRFLAHESACDAFPGYVGMGADVLARAGRNADAETHAHAALDRDSADAHAMFALAMVARGTPDAARAAERADAAQYGDDATLLVGIADLDAGDLPRAADSFRRVLARSPDHVGATYDLALVADRQGNFHDAREGYLATLRLDPRYADARYNLALLTLHAGALPEARHHMEELALIAPDDPRLPALRATLAE